MPAERLWGAQTERSRTHFAIGDPAAYRWPRGVIRALGLVKAAAAEANQRLGQIDASVAGLIAQGAVEVISGHLDAEFPLGVFQTGSGTHTNMNANEVIANRANQIAGGPLGAYRPVHPNDHVNRGQSSNDVFPAVMHLATLEALHALEPAVRNLSAALAAHVARWTDVPMLGRRTCRTQPRSGSARSWPAGPPRSTRPGSGSRGCTRCRWAAPRSAPG